jgi:hypothetical protein
MQEGAISPSRPRFYDRGASLCVDPASVSQPLVSERLRVDRGAKEEVLILEIENVALLIAN